MSLSLLEQLVSFTDDPLGFALWAFPWGESGTLVDRQLEAWQRELLESVGKKLTSPDDAIRQAAIREATVSGNGVGKSALVSILILWAATTFPDTKGVVTANTETQLKTKTWAELGKWFQMFIARDMFELSATALFSRDPDHKLTWRVDQVPWSEHNAVAFQGLHNEGKRLFLIFDEASGIVDTIWEAADGCMTDAGTQRLWFVFGNPNLPEGRFKECFPPGSQAGRWTSRRIDSRSVSFTDKAEFAAWVAEHGEDSDFVRVRVRGEFPRVGFQQFISPDLVAEAAKRDLPRTSKYDPLIIGVDVARFGDDASRIVFRRGRDARTHAATELRKLDTMELAARVADFAMRLKADMVFVDEGGVGGGVVDRLRQLRIKCIGIQFGSKSDRQVEDGGANKYANKRAEMYGLCREWLRQGAIEDNPALCAELSATNYSFNVRDEILLEAKKDLKKRLPTIGSPDWADALVLTFAYPVAANWAAGDFDNDNAPKVLHEYDPFDLREIA